MRYLFGLRSVGLILVSCAVATCDSDPAAPLIDCTSWESCSGGLVATTEVIDTAFDHARGTKYLPGDSMLLRIRVENRASIPTDSIVISHTAAGLGEPRYSAPFVLAPREVREIVDTAIVTFTFGEVPEMKFEARRSSSDFDIAIARRGTTTLNIARSGFSFDMQNLPGPYVTFHYHGLPRTGSQVRHSDTVMLSVRITNIFETNLPPISLAGCLWNQDHCFEQFESTNASPVLIPGMSADVTMTIVPDAAEYYFDWYSQQNFSLGVCAETILARMPCDGALIHVVANFEKDCAVDSAVVGVSTTDAMPDCGRRKDGSAYRFTARAGERYRVSSPDAVVFIAPENGVPDFLTRPREVTIPADGTYYVVLLHRGAANFLLERIG
jgi:hypothetical protein